MRVARCSALLASLASLLMVLQAPPASGQVRRALLIGIGTYAPAAPGAAAPRKLRNLAGPPNDIAAISAVISRLGFQKDNIHVLRDGQATREAILAAYRRYLIKEAAPGDVGLLYYSGHGSTVKNTRTRSGIDQTTVPYDAPTGALDIRDKEWARLFKESAARGVILTAVFDSCYSGSISRGVESEPQRSVRAAEPDPRAVDDPEDPGLSAADLGVLIFSASRSDQEALEHAFGDGVYGDFTRALLQVWPASRRETAQWIFTRVKSLMQATSYFQEPILDANAARRGAVLLGGAPDAQPDSIVVGVVADLGQGKYAVQGGYAQSIYSGAVLRQVGPPPATAPRARVIRLEGPSRSVVQIEPGVGTVRLKPGDLLEVDQWSAGDDPGLQVRIGPALPQTQLVKAATTLRALRVSSRLLWVADPTALTPDYVLSWQGSEWSLSRAGGASASLGAAPTVAAVEQRLPRTTPPPSVFVNLPPPAELVAALTQITRPNGLVAAAASGGKADYLLLGRAAASGIEYAWVRPNRLAETVDPLPVTTAWVPLPGDPAKRKGAAFSLNDLALRLGKLRGWLTLASPPNNDRFPYRLVLQAEDKGTAMIEASSTNPKLYEGQKVVARLIRKGPERPRQVEGRYIYLLTLDSKGTTQLLWPAAPPGGACATNADNFIDLQPSTALPEQIPLAAGQFLFSVAPPFGADTYLLLTTREAISDLCVLAQEGVSRSPDGPRTALGRLIASIGDPERGSAVNHDLATPLNWSIERVSLESVASQPRR